MTGSSWLALGLLGMAAELSVGVAPFDALGMSDSEAGELRLVVEHVLGEERDDLTLVVGSEVDRAARELDLEAGEVGACLRDTSCAAELARRAGADQLVLGSAAGLGRTYVLRLALLDARRGVVDREVHRTVVGGLADLRGALPEQVERLIPPPPDPWYRRWWVWTTVAVGLAAVAAAVTLALLLPEEQNPIDTYPLP